MGSISLWIGLPIFFLGLAVGSFVNVLVMRALRGEQFLWGRSHCDACGRPLAWWEMIPLLSFVALKGRCHTCGEEIDVMHPVVEFLTGALFLWWWLIGFAFFRLTTAPHVILQPLFWLTIGVLLLIITVIDWKSFLIPDWGTIAVFGLVILYRLVLLLDGLYQPVDLAWSLFGSTVLLLFFLFLWFITKKRGIGFGDVKLIFPLGLLMGWPSMFVGVFLAFLIGAVTGVTLLVSGKLKANRALPFGPFLVVGTFLSLLYGDSLLRWYLTLL